MSQNRATPGSPSRRVAFLKLLALASIAVLGIVLLSPSGPARPRSALADLCSTTELTGTLTINVSGQGTVSGFNATISPTTTDDGQFTNQGISVTAPITALNACATDTNLGRNPGYDVQLSLTGDASSRCSFSGNPSTGGGAMVSLSEVSNVPVPHGGNTTVTFYVSCVSPTATVGATATAVGGTSVALGTTSSIVGCGGSSFVSATVKDSGGNPVSGVLVSFVTSLGFVSSAASTDVNGTALVVYTAPTTVSATASITASGNGFSGGTSIVVDCQPAAPRVIPPAQPAVVVAPPVSVPPASVSVPATGVITPPNTGDGGLAD